MNIKVARTEYTGEKNRDTIANGIDLVFLDDDTKEVAGHCKYFVVGGKGYVFETYLYPEYRNKKILKSFIDDIFCDIKCMGAKEVFLDTFTDEAKTVWERFGFKVTEGRNMKRDISKENCICRCGTYKFKNEVTVEDLLPYRYKYKKL